MVAEFDMIFGQGISKSGDILDVASEFDIVKKAGAWYSYNGERIGQGREKAKEYLEENPFVMDEIRAKIMEIVEAKRNGGENVGFESNGSDDENN